MVQVPWWLPWAQTTLMLMLLVGSAWFDHYSKKRLREATAYWQRSNEVWTAIGAVPEDQITEEGLRKLEAFLGDEVDQSGSIPSDYAPRSHHDQE